MGKIYYGCDDLQRGWDHYFRQCNAFELNIESLDAPPRIETLNRWRVESPRGFCFVLHADPRVAQGLARRSRTGETTLDETIREGWQTTLERARALAAKAILVRTPAEFSPGDDSRRLLETFAEELASDAKPAVIWEGQGLWQLADAREFARHNGLVWAYDPFIAHREDIPFTHGDACWVLTERAGLRRKFDQFDMETLTHWADRYDRVFALLRGRFQWDHARELKVAVEHGE